jgi:hypothetical protein
MARRTYVRAAYADDRNPLPAVGYDTASGQKISITSSSAQSAALSEGVYLVSVSTACYLAIGSNPTASNGATNLPLFGAAQLALLVREGEKIAVIRDSADGAMWITPARTS